MNHKLVDASFSLSVELFIWCQKLSDKCSRDCLSVIQTIKKISVMHFLLDSGVTCDKLALNTLGVKTLEGMMNDIDLTTDIISSMCLSSATVDILLSFILPLSKIRKNITNTEVKSCMEKLENAIIQRTLYRTITSVRQPTPRVAYETLV